MIPTITAEKKPTPTDTTIIIPNASKYFITYVYQNNILQLIPTKQLLIL